ncbi:MAG TPA: hypothetical protein VK952_05555 [Methylotenera sp.]|nr:hypothetical protein [Methylotenera sp.]
MHKLTYKLIVLLGLILSSNFASADLPKTRTSPTGITYMTGGIGEEEVAVMKPQAKKFTLNLLFSEGMVGRWVTDINVNIYDEASKLVFRIVGAKNVLYVNMPAGTYTILANNNGNKLRHKVTLEANTNQKVVLNWKDLGNNQIVDEDMPLDAEGN